MTGRLDSINASRGGVAKRSSPCRALDWGAIVPGAELQVGEVRLRITKYTTPCEKVAFSFCENDDTRISQTLHPGWSRVSARVLTGGLVRIGDPAEQVLSPEPSALSPEPLALFSAPSTRKAPPGAPSRA